MIHIRFITVILFTGLLQSLQSCSKKIYTVNSGSVVAKSTNPVPDYTLLKYWAAHPWKYDPSDSVPKPLQNKTTSDSLADIFFIHPTTFTDYAQNSWNAEIEDSLLTLKTDYTTILYQASVFNEQCRVFAPRYRQAHLRAFFTSEKNKADSSLDIAYTDIRNAFIQYLNNFNNGNPIILASHSQGTVHAGRLLKEFFEEQPLNKKLVCAYLIGMPISENYFKVLQPCADSTATGCFISWRTYQRGYIDTQFVSKENYKAWVTNPLTWKLTDEYAPVTSNTGGILKNFNRIAKNVVDAQVHSNILWTCKPKFFGNVFLKQKNYHVGDINLFYTNIRTNVKTRIAAYKKSLLL